MKIGNFELDREVLLVAEIGNNHEGNFDTAVQLIEEAANAGANAVKFQTFKTEHYVNAAQEERCARLKSFELSCEQYSMLSEIAKGKGLLFISTAFDLHSARFLKGICDGLKLSSSDNTFYPLIQELCGSGLPVIASTGLASFEEIDNLVKLLKTAAGGYALLHCISAYPPPLQDVNLRFINVLKSRYGCVVGYSDHTLGIDAAVASVAVGARIVEKHFTLDKNFSAFRDHQLSADPKDFAEMVRRIRNLEQMLGSGVDIVASEKPNITALRRSIVAARELPAGHRLKIEDITWVRPGGGLAPGMEEMLLGKKLLKPVKFHEVLAASHVEENL